jgi:hypothetical protein
MRRSCRSTARTTHSTRSSASFDQRRKPFSYVINGLVPVISLGRVNDLLSGMAGTSPARLKKPPALPSVTKRLAGTRQTWPFVFVMLRQILSRGL